MIRMSGMRFSEKIMPQQKVRVSIASIFSDRALMWFRALDFLLNDLAHELSGRQGRQSQERSYKTDLKSNSQRFFASYEIKDIDR
jgi:hypothetical protein